MEFRVLGPLEVVAGGELVALGSPKQRALLATLVLSANRVVGVDRLIEELWGDEAPARAMASLQAYVSRLRRLLQPAGARRSRSDVLVTRPPGYLLHVDPASIDAERFERGVAEGTRLLADGDASAALGALESALGLWRGPPYGDFSFEEFAQAEIARLGELHLAAIEARLAALVGTGQAAAAVAEAEAVVRDHPLREGVWASLMTALYRAGRQGDALRAYQRARAVMGEELGIGPGPGLRELEAKILDQSLDLEPVARRSPSAVATPKPSPSPAPVSPAEEPLVGRQQELRRLGGAMTAALGGRGCAVVLHGEPGIGKTRLAREVVRRATEAGAVAGHGGCVEGDVTAAYWPWTHALREVLGDLDPGELPAGVRESLAELAQIDPALARWAGDAPTPVPLADPDLARARLQRAAIDALVGVARTRPVVVVVEDLQWADQPSLQLLSLLAPELDSAPLMVVVTYRDQEVGDALAATLGALGGGGANVDLALGGLDPDAVHRFVEATAGERVSEAVAASIGARTAGNPLFVGELTRLLRSERALDEHGVDNAPVPAGVRDVIRRRLERLPAQTTTVLTVAAIIGRRFDVGLLGRVAQLSEDELLDQVESAVAVGLVAEDRTTVGAFSFTHDLVRDTLQTALSGTRRARLHARVAQALLDHGDGADPALPFVVSHHLLEALPLVPPEEVAPHVLAAADAAVARLGFEQAKEQLRRGLDLVEMLPAESRSTYELAVRVRLGQVLILTEGYAYPEVRTHTGRAVELAAAVEPRPDVVQAMWGAAVAAGAGAEYATARAIGRNLLAWGEEHHDPAALCLGHTLVGLFSWPVPELESAAHHLGAAFEIVDTAQPDLSQFYDPNLSSGVLMRAAHALVAWIAGRDDEATLLMEDALRRAEDSGQEFLLVFARTYDAWLAVFRGDRPHARRRAQQAIDRADVLGHRQFSVMARILSASAHHDPAIRALELEEAVTGWEPTGARLLQTFFSTLRAEAQLDLGRPEDAAVLLHGALDAAKTTGERFYEPEIHRLLGVVALQRGQIEEAAAHYGRGIDVARELGVGGLGKRVSTSLEQLGGALASGFN